MVLRGEALAELARRRFLTFDGSPCFFDYAKYRGIPQGGGVGGPTPFERWPHVVEMAQSFQTERLIAVLKARQLGFSWGVALWGLYNMIGQSEYSILMFSKGEREAKELLRKFKYIYRHLPDEIKSDRYMVTDSRFELELENGSRVMAFPSTDDAGRGETASLVIQDEADFHPYMESNQLAVKPSIDAGGQHIIGSTSNKKEMVSLFKETFKAAQRGENGFAAMFFPWNVVPDRDQEWYDRTKATIPPTLLSSMSPEMYMEQEYPDSVEQALSPVQADAAFDLEILRHMMQAEIREPVKTVGDHINIYQHYSILGGPYSIGTDTGHGTGRDYSVSVIIDRSSGRIVADIMSNQMDPNRLADETMEMAAMYRNPIWTMEVNEWGILVLEAAQKRFYPRIYNRNYDHPTREVLEGWLTTHSSRKKVWGNLIEHVRTGYLSVPNHAGLSQFFDCIYNYEKDRVEAVGGRNDDYPMACALAVEGFPQAYGGTISTERMPSLWAV